MSDSKSQSQSASGLKDSVVWKWEKGVMPTDNQLRVAKNLGAEASVLERMKSEGMNRSTYYHVIPAEAAEEHMGAKYGIPFRAIDATVDSNDKENAVRVIVEPEQGDYAGEDFTVWVKWAEESDPMFTENYFRAVRDEEYASYVEGLLKDAMVACPHDVCVVAELGSYLSVGDGFDAKTPIADVVSSCDGRLSIVFAPASNMDEQTYQSELAGILKAASAVNPAFFYEAGYVEKLEPTDGSFNAAVAMSYLHATDDKRRASCIWRLSGTVSEGIGS